MINKRELHVGESVQRVSLKQVKGGFVDLLGEQYYCIHNFDRMPPFFMTVVSGSDQWMFISSTGGLSAGRASADVALFPYYTDDRISENYENTGHVAILRVTRGRRIYLWEPLSERYAGLYDLERNLYKNEYGDKLIFEEINHDLGLSYRYAWRTSDRYGFVKTAWIANLGKLGCHISLLDGLQNLLPAGATTLIQNSWSNLLNAYKRNELDPGTGLGIFSLSATLTDRAEPSESLRATTVWQAGLKEVNHLLCANQLDLFRHGFEVVPETDVRGCRGAYLVQADLDLRAGREREWNIVADVNRDGADVAGLIHFLKQDPQSIQKPLDQDIILGTENLRSIVASADGLQASGEHLTTAHHLSNVLFNTMRGGIFADQYFVEKNDLVDFFLVRNRVVYRQYGAFFDSLPEKLASQDLLQKAVGSGSSDLERLCYEYLPLTFGRRHGDPSRPWNRFSINLRKPDGSKNLDYQGNWRDIFQNWEPLAWSYPEFAEQMTCKFLNATTADGYNPYRVTRDGIEWEIPAPHDPWANIGYWGDHQIIYLQKLLEVSSRFHPGRLQALLGRNIFSHANVPYHIKKYTVILDDWYNTIEFDRDLDHVIEQSVAEMGSDGKLVKIKDGRVFHVNLVEKMLILLLAKLGNLVPEGGIWMNTQRPEWNDGNNALVGKGLSVVTACYLRRYIVFFHDLLAGSAIASVSVTHEVRDLLTSEQTILEKYRVHLSGQFSDERRRAVMDELGQASSIYRWNYYQHGLSGQFSALSKDAVLEFLTLARLYIDHTLKANERPDHLFHAYNILHLTDGQASVGHLYEMLEGQVAVLSSGLLSSGQSLTLLQNLRKGKMYRPDQHSYMLYPDRELPGFLRKNRLTIEQVQGLALVEKLVKAGDRSLVVPDVDDVYHFNASFRNAGDVRSALRSLKLNPKYADLVEAEEKKILDLFEAVFDHKSFTGRSGTFFAYEGLGSIYWHMVSKLLLAVQETVVRAHQLGEPQPLCRGLADVYYEIRNGLGFNKPPDVYGAFPTDPYSHTPSGQGAKQPGMSGQVKEEILARFTELGLFVKDGVISFDPFLLRTQEFLPSPTAFDYIDVSGRRQTLSLPAGTLAYTFCQVPFMYLPAPEARIEILLSDGTTQVLDGRALTAELSQHIFRRTGQARQVVFYRGQ